MYLRHTTRKKDGKVHRTWRLVRSVRIGRRVIQQTVAHLGELDRAGRLRARALARSLIGEPEQADLFNDGADDRTLAVHLKGVRVEHGRQFGNVYLALTLWRACRLDEFCRAHIPGGKEEVPWEKIVAVLVAARLCEPSSELHIAEDWYRRTALPDLLQLNESLVNKDRLYRALDALLPHKAALEAHLSKRHGELFAVENEILLYDVTSTYFEGKAEGNPQAQRGYSRDHRGDCKQVCIALIVTFDGFPLGYEVFPGNTHDSTTVQQIVETMERRHGAIGKVWCMDRGMVSAENVAWLKQTGRRYILGTPKSELKKWEAALTDKTCWREIREGIEVKLLAAPEGDKEIFILCRSRDRVEKEKAMHEKFARRIEAALEKLKTRISKSQKRLNPDTLNRQIGRILERNQRAAARFAIALKPTDTPAGCALTVSVNEAFDQWAALSEGTYLLRSNVTDWDDEKLWKAYIQLTQAEAAFRIQKGDLSIRPIWHQRADRVQAHILVCFLAFVLWKTLECWQARAGLGHSPRTLLEEMARIHAHDVILPTQELGEVRLRCITQPDPAQAALLDRLGLVLPKRIRLPEVDVATPATRTVA
ncbi:MAG: IS1634 family transposase [Acidiferrobacterales bacterium]